MNTHFGFKTSKAMGDCTQTLRETGLEVQAMSMHGGEYSEAENVKMFKAPDL
jgi:hypothetical protein